MYKKFNSLEQIQKYYVEEINTYVFQEYNRYIDLVIFDFNLDINSNIVARDIRCQNISAFDIKKY